MAANFEQALSALYTRLQNQVAGIKTFARIYIEPNQVQSEQQPLLILQSVAYEVFNPAGGRATKQRGHPNVWLMHIAIIIYIQMPEAIDPTTLSPETTLNDYLAQVMDCLSWQQDIDKYDPTNMTDANLNGIVQRVSMEGPIAFLSGAAAQQGSVVIPIEILIAE